MKRNLDQHNNETSEKLENTIREDLAQEEVNQQKRIKTKIQKRS